MSLRYISPFTGLLQLLLLFMWLGSSAQRAILRLANRTEPAVLEIHFTSNGRFGVVVWFGVCLVFRGVLTDSLHSLSQELVRLDVSQLSLAKRRSR